MERGGVYGGGDELMKIRMLKLAAGPRGVWQPGAVVEVEPDEAAELIQAGAGEPMREAKVETAVIEPGEKAVMVRTETGKREKAGPGQPGEQQGD